MHLLLLLPTRILRKVLLLSIWIVLYGWKCRTVIEKLSRLLSHQIYSVIMLLKTRSIAWNGTCLPVMSRLLARLEAR